MNAIRNACSLPVLGARLLAGFLLLAAGLGKFFDPDPALPSLMEYASLPPAVARGAVAFLAVTECVAALWILFRPGVNGFRLGLVLSASFVAWTTYLLLVHADVSCGCFGGFDADRTVGWLDLLKSAGLLIITASLVRDATRDRA